VANWTVTKKEADLVGAPRYESASRPSHSPSPADGWDFLLIDDSFGAGDSLGFIAKNPELALAEIVPVRRNRNEATFFG
jgi:hypothetical protein